LAAAACVAAGCGSTGRGQSSAHTTTVSVYAGYPSDTITVASGKPDSPTCRVDARSFVRSSRVFLAHAGPKSAYPPDAYYMIMREELADFAVRRCDLALLGSALAALTERQRRTLESDLPQEMVATIRKGLAAAGS
jgi:hypothetical protein